MSFDLLRENQTSRLKLLSTSYFSLRPHSSTAYKFPILTHHLFHHIFYYLHLSQDALITANDGSYTPADLCPALGAAMLAIL